MRLLTWNAAMKFREKIEYVLPFESDILVVPECEATEKWQNSKFKGHIKQFLWFGDNPNKGIGIFTLTTDYKIEIHPTYSNEFQYIIPLKVSGKEDFLLLAVWTQNTKKQYFSYIGQLFMALKYYQSLLSEQCIIAGDWNSNKFFDHIKRIGTHTEVVEFLSEYTIHSTYHTFYKENQGEETLPTHYFRKAHAQPFHIDHVFGSNSFIDRVQKVEVGTYDNWIQYSDHLPIFVEFT